MSKRKKLTYTDSSGKRYDLDLFDTELSLGESSAEEFKDLEKEVELDVEVKDLAKRITKLKGDDTNIYVYHGIGISINFLFNKYRKKKTTGFRSKQKILDRITYEINKIKNVKGITVRQLRTMSEFAYNVANEEIKAEVSWSIYSEIFTHKLSTKNRNILFKLLDEGKLTKRDDVRKWIHEKIPV